MSKNRFVLDASVILALFHEEEGSQKILTILKEGVCFVSTVNLAEIASKLLLKGVSEEKVLFACAFPDFEIVSFNEDIAIQAALLTPKTKPLGLSLGERACLATALTKQAVALTTDRIWLKIKDGPPIEVIR